MHNHPWYVLRSKPQKEEFLYQQLMAREIEAFFPCLCVKPVNPRSRKTSPYFPGYLFVRIDESADCLSDFQWMPGSMGLVSFGGEPATVPVELINTIRQIVEFANASFGKRPAYYMPGDLLVIHNGLFDGYEAIFDSHMPGSDRVRVLLQYLKGRQMPLVLPALDIEPARRSY
jgi:transcriptional antiterminator RfaH